MKGPFCVTDLVLAAELVCKDIQPAGDVSRPDGYPVGFGQTKQVHRFCHQSLGPGAPLPIDVG